MFHRNYSDFSWIVREKIIRVPFPKVESHFAALMAFKDIDT